MVLHALVQYIISILLLFRIVRKYGWRVEGVWLEKCVIPCMNGVR